MLGLALVFWVFALLFTHPAGSAASDAVEAELGEAHVMHAGLGTSARGSASTLSLCMTIINVRLICKLAL